MPTRALWNLSRKPEGASDKPIKLEWPCFNYFKAIRPRVALASDIIHGNKRLTSPVAIASTWKQAFDVIILIRYTVELVGRSSKALELASKLAAGCHCQ